MRGVRDKWVSLTFMTALSTEHLACRMRVRACVRPIIRSCWRRRIAACYSLPGLYVIVYDIRSAVIAHSLCRWASPYRVTVTSASTAPPWDNYMTTGILILGEPTCGRRSRSAPLPRLLHFFIAIWCECPLCTRISFLKVFDMAGGRIFISDLIRVWVWSCWILENANADE